MQGTRKVAHMKGRSNKLVDLPVGAKPQRTRKCPTAHAVSEAIIIQQSDSILNSKEVNTMTTSKKQVIARALKSEISTMPEGMETRPDIVMGVLKSPIETLIRVYPLMDASTASECDRVEVAIAELLIKYEQGGAPNVVGEWISTYGETPKERQEILQAAIDSLEGKIKESETIFEKVDGDNNFTRHRQVAILSSLATSALVGGAKMLMNDNFGKGEILKTVAGAAISGTVTTVAMNALSDKELGNMESAGIGAGIGLVIGGSLTFGLDMFCAGENDGAESVSELPAPVEA